ncbi:MAG: hypothetical protein ACXIUV_12060 [Alkalilacustris sp.]
MIPLTSSLPTPPLGSVLDRLSEILAQSNRPPTDAERGLALMERHSRQVDAVAQGGRLAAALPVGAPASTEVPQAPGRPSPLILADAPPALNAEAAFRALSEMSEQRREQHDLTRFQVYREAGIESLTQSLQTTRGAIGLLG